MADYTLSAKGTYDGSNFNKGISGSSSALDSFVSKCGSVGSRVTSSLSKVVSVGAKVTGVLGGLATGAFVKGGIDRSLNIEQARFKLGQLGMDVQSVMASANTAVDGTAFSLASAATSASLMGAAGVAAGDQMTRSLQAATGVAAIGGVEMERVSQVFSKVAAAGKLQGDELMQLSEMGVNATSALAKHMGKTQAEVRDLVSKGEVDFQTFSDAMYETFGEAAYGANATFSGAMSNVRAALSRTSAKFADPALQALKGVFVALIPAINAVSVALEPAVAVFADFCEMLSGRVADAISVFTDVLTSTGSVLEGFKAGMAKAFEGTVVMEFVENVSSRMKGFAALWRMGETPMEKFRLVAVNAMNTASEAVSSLVDLLVQKFPQIAPAVDFARSALEGIDQAISTTSKLWNAGRNPIESFKLVAVRAMLEVSRAVSDFVAGLVQRFPQIAPVVEIAKTAIGGIKDAFSAVAKVVSPIVHGLVEGVKGFFDAFSGSVDIGALAAVASMIGSFASPFGVVSSLARKFGSDLQRLAETVGSSLVPMLTTLGQILGGTLAALLPGVQSALSALFPMVQSIIGAVTNIASSVLPLVVSIMQQVAPIIVQIAGFVGQLLSAIAPLIASLVSSLLPVITNVVQAIMNFVTAVMPAVISVANLVMSVIQALLPVVTSVVSVVVSVVSAIVSAIGAVIAVVVNIATVVASFVSTVVSSAANILSVVISVFGTISAFVSSAISTVVSVVTQGFNAAASIVGSAANAIGALVSGLFSTVSSIFAAIVSTITGAVNSAFNAAQNAFANIVSTVSSAISSVLDVVGSLPGKIQGFFVGAGSWLMDAGRSIIQGLADGILNAVGVVTGAIENVLGAVRNFLPFSPAKTGPFSGKGWTLYSGQSITEALGEGVKMRASKAVRAVSHVMQEMTEVTFGAPDLAFAGGYSFVPASAPENEAQVGATYNFGDITIDAHDLGGVRSATEFVERLVREGRSR